MFFKQKIGLQGITYLICPMMHLPEVGSNFKVEIGTIFVISFWPSIIIRYNYKIIENAEKSGGVIKYSNIRVNKLFLY